MKEITNKAKTQREFLLEKPNANGERSIQLRPREARVVTDEEFQSRHIQKAVAKKELRVRDV